jgi:hypothetical protein
VRPTKAIQTKAESPAARGAHLGPLLQHALQQARARLQALHPELQPRELPPQLLQLCAQPLRLGLLAACAVPRLRRPPQRAAAPGLGLLGSGSSSTRISDVGPSLLPAPATPCLVSSPLLSLMGASGPYRVPIGR